MDTSDPNIIFDDSGVCDYCSNFQIRIKPKWHAEKANENNLKALGEKIRSKKTDTEFDCIIGLSGGLDSSFAAHILATKMGLRPLLFHVDAGWNTDLAVSNIECLVEGLGLDLYTEVINWDEIRRLQVAFLKSGIPDQDLVQDAAFFSSLYKFARKHKIKHIITGANFATECCREPQEWGGYLGIDKRLFSDIWKRFGEGSLNSFPIVDILEYKILYQRILGMKVHHPLNMTEYNKVEAEKELSKHYGWQKFQHKHHESRFTRFFEDFWLPTRFKFDKRRAHFSSLIMTGQMKREAAIKRLQTPEMEKTFLEQEFNFVADKLMLGEKELNQILTSPKRTFKDYKNKQHLIMTGARLMKVMGAENRHFR